ncbi:hypothetical protein [Deefgea piscis]|nr:hypothetical protein [Deefgea piscis]
MPTKSSPWRAAVRAQSLAQRQMNAEHALGICCFGSEILAEGVE